MRVYSLPQLSDAYIKITVIRIQDTFQAKQFNILGERSLKLISWIKSISFFLSLLNGYRKKCTPIEFLKRNTVRLTDTPDAWCLDLSALTGELARKPDEKF